MSSSSNGSFSLGAASLLLVEGTNQGMDILVQICVGFGVRHSHRANSADEAMGLLRKVPVDLMICATDLPATDGYELVRQLRRSSLDPNASIPVILISGHTPLKKVLYGRDSGANVVVVKPLTPKVLLDRILWLATDKRDFVVCPTYAGPDRRWQNLGPPVGTKGRRKTDLSTHVGVAVDPNLDQSDIDAMFRPTKVSI